MLRVNFTKDALETLQGCPPKHAKQIAHKIQQLSTDPTSLPIKELRGSEGFFRAKSGEYRIVFSIDNHEFKIWLIGKRNDDAVYKRFERKF